MWFPVFLVLFDSYKGGWSSPNLLVGLVAGVVVLAALAALGSKPVLRCDGCAYTTDAS